ncbi:MAG TPA: hypothetical protein VG713_18765, partial [Pirellulales bacterium]|nr:hypothetical protein [Pirellulales bacterium]
VLYFNAGGDAFLDVEYESDTQERADLAPAILLTEDAEPQELVDDLDLDDRLIERGRGLFASLGCAACHKLREADAEVDIASTLKAPKLSALDPERGCLSAAPHEAPNYALSAAQRRALASALANHEQASTGKADAKEMIPQYLAALNCVACHQRDGFGGVEPERNDYFVSTIKEMGDEGRLPPLLTGVGGKVRMSWLRDLVGKGVKDRPYMLTRMPVFGLANAKPVIEAMAAADKLPPVAELEFSEPPYRVKDQGRFLIGSKAFSCVKCHTFGEFKAEGIQSIDMTTMTRRLERDWFVRYVRDPLAFRPGTRMPAAWPKTGKSFLPTVFDGDADKQIAAVWTYLLDGKKAAAPVGVGGQPIDLVATTEPIVYRGFLEGVGPRGIAVGFPQGVDYSFDADALRLAMIWKGGLIDASKHWGGRGGGFQPPLGDHVTPLPAGRAIVRLASPSAPWPEEAGRADGYQFLGYRLDEQRAPRLRYRVLGVEIDDAIQPTAVDNQVQLERTMTMTTAKPAEGLWLRAAVGERIEPAAEGWYTVDRVWRVRLEGVGTPAVRTSGGRQELVAPLVFDSSGRGTIRETFRW